MGHKIAERFDFREDRHTRAFTCARVRDGAPVLLVSHADGDWQFLCGGEHDGVDGPDGIVLVCLECAVADDPSLNELADLCGQWSAERERPGAPWERHDGMEDLVREKVDEHGWFVMQVMAGEEPDEPAFAYTIGLHSSYGHPELIIVGLRIDLMLALLNVCGNRIKAGERLPVDEPFDRVLDGYPVCLRTVFTAESRREHVGYATWFHGGDDFRLLQLVWPDKQGRFPGEPDAAPIMATQQPLLP
jgi:hypothetical protein